MPDPRDRAIVATFALDLLDAAVERTLGPQCRTVSVAGVRCVLDLEHDGICDVRPWRRPGREVTDATG